MLRGSLNLGILAHVDAGKTTLTERLLYAAGVIDEVGSVDAGTTRTDSLELERRRGITIRSAVVSFPVHGVPVNLIDTPGHPDFIAEVERVLNVLDGAVLVISAVEGVQPQTRVLMRALQRLRVPTLMFVNKIDRAGADPERVLDRITARLGVRPVPMGSVTGPGTRAARFTPWRTDDAGFRTRLADALADRSDALLAAYVENEAGVTDRRLRDELGTQTRLAQVHPVWFGSAITGAGVAELMSGLAELLPVDAGDADGPLSGSVFKVERGPAGEKVAYVRLFSGTLRTRDRVPTTAATTSRAANGNAKVTAISVFDGGDWVRRDRLCAGGIAKVWGLGGIRVGDPVGHPRATAGHHFAPPTLETVVTACDPADRGALRVALAQLAEQDPLIDVRQDDARQEISVCLYGEVQKEVVQATLADEYGIAVEFRGTTTICVERPAGTGEAVELLNTQSNPFQATIGLRVDPPPDGSGIDFRMRVDPRTVPMYVYKSFDSFAETMDRYVRQALREGLSGWQVTDCTVTLVRCGYSLADGPPSKRGPLSTPGDFRKLTPMVLMQALQRAGTVVCEPSLRVSLEVPAGTVGAVLTALARLGAAVDSPPLAGEYATFGTVLPAARVPDLQRLLPGLTGGEGVLETGFDGYRPVSGAAPTRRRTTANPLHREEYLAYLTRQGTR